MALKAMELDEITEGERCDREEVPGAGKEGEPTRDRAHPPWDFSCSLVFLFGVWMILHVLGL